MEIAILYEVTRYKIINLHHCKLSVPYEQILCLQIGTAYTLLHERENNETIYLPMAFSKKVLLTFYSYSEDTVDGQATTSVMNSLAF